jgi:hypothetical protein
MDKWLGNSNHLLSDCGVPETWLPKHLVSSKDLTDLCVHFFRCLGRSLSKKMAKYLPLTTFEKSLLPEQVSNTKLLV